MSRFVFMLACALVSCSAGMAQYQLKVTVKNIASAEGSVRVGLFDRSRDFLKRPVFGQVIAATGDSLTVNFKGLPAGTYAISAIHDKNDNGELDTNLLGIPKEGFAFGNNAMGMFGPPSFEKASVTIGKGVVVQVLELKHL